MPERSAVAPRPEPVASAESRPSTPIQAVSYAGPTLLAGSCARCGAPGAPGMRFCRECGAPVAGEAQPTAPVSVPEVRSLRPPGAGAVTPGLTPQPFAPPPGVQSTSGTGQPRLVMLLRDGSEGRVIPLGQGDTDIGGREGEIVFADDPYLSPRHARISCRSGAYTIRDLDSVNGVYVRLREPREVRDRDMVLLGQQVLRFELLLDGELPLGPAWQGGVLVFGTPEVPRSARLVQYTSEGVGRDVHYLFRDETVIGRENGDIVFTDDPFLSRRHAAIRVDQAGRRYTLHDLGSSNGTALRIRGEHVLREGDQFRVGRHLFRFEAGSSGGRAER